MRCFTRLSLCVLTVLVCFMSVDRAHAAVNLPNDPPSDPPFYGGYYVTGSASGLGTVTVYFPDGEGWSVDDSGCLFHSDNSSTSGVLYTASGTEYDFSAPAYSLPRYRLSDGGSYYYTDLRLVPTATNVVIADTFDPVYDLPTMLQFCVIAALGLIFVSGLLHRR